MVNEKGEEVGIIYGWYCIPTNKWYIGQTANPEGRFNQHKYEAITKKDNSIFHKAIRKYGLENFVYCLLEDNILKENLNMREIAWIEYYDSFYSGYNSTFGGRGPQGFIMSKELRKRISESHKGKPSNRRKKVSKYDLNGNYIQTYNSVAEATNQNPKCLSIYSVCSGISKQTGGFIWKYA